MDRGTRNFYLFLGLHGFLLGLFPFFLPVYLFKNGGNLSQISWFICFTGLGFSLTLWLWERLRGDSYLASIVVSLVLESVLILLVLFHGPLYLIALVNGMYSCLYWTIQRVFFLAGESSEGSGKRFGNVQIFVMIILKSGIIVGSLLLEYNGLYSVFLLSLLVAGFGISLFVYSRWELEFPLSLLEQKPLSLGEVVTFSDGCHSRLIFAIDGVFLYFESYFWLISLFIIVKQSFTRLGVLIIVLALVLAALFYFIKNRIDRVDKQRMYVFSVVVYAVSWEARGWMSGDLDYAVQMSLLVLIAFCTAFFRLAFNTRFFDTAEKSSRYRYLFIKSYYSQMFLAAFFAFLAWQATSWEDVEVVLGYCYLFAGLFSFVYLFFKPLLADSRVARQQ